jgi:hypothetical protein
VNLYKFNQRQLAGLYAPMKMAERQALALRDLAVNVVMAKGIITASDSYSYHDARIRIEYGSGNPSLVLRHVLAGHRRHGDPG